MKIQSKKNMVIIAAMVSLVMAGTASADFWGGVNVPDWSGNANYTNQTWTFTSEVNWMDVDIDGDSDMDAGLIMPPIAADTGYSNPYFASSGMGPITYPGLYYTTWGDSFAWDWIDDSLMGSPWEGLQGMIGGMGGGSIDLYVPIADVAGTTDVWIQYVSYIPNAASGADVDAELALDSDFTNLIGTQTGKSYQQITVLDDQGTSGNWWLVTEQWEVEDAGSLLYVRINADAAGTSNMVDSVQVMTSAVPEPATMALLACGFGGLIIRRRKA